MLKKIALVTTMLGVLTYGSATYAFMPFFSCSDCFDLYSGMGLSMCEVSTICRDLVDQKIEVCIDACIFPID